MEKVEDLDLSFAFIVPVQKCPIDCYFTDWSEAGSQEFRDDPTLAYPHVAGLVIMPAMFNLSRVRQHPTDGRGTSTRSSSSSLKPLPCHWQHPVSALQAQNGGLPCFETHKEQTKKEKICSLDLHLAHAFLAHFGASFRQELADSPPKVSILLVEVLVHGMTGGNGRSVQPRVELGAHASGSGTIVRPQRQAGVESDLNVYEVCCPNC